MEHFLFLVGVFVLQECLFLGLELLLLVLAVLHQFLVLLQDLVARHAELWVDKLIDWFED